MEEQKTKAGRLTSYLIDDGMIPLNKKLIHIIGANAAIFYGELVRKYDYFETRGDLTDDGYFFNTIKNMRLDTGLTRYYQDEAINTLVELGMIEKDNRPVPNSPKSQDIRHFKIKFDYNTIDEILEKGVENKEKLAEKLAKKNKEDKQKLLEYSDKSHSVNGLQCTMQESYNVQCNSVTVNKNKANKNKLNKDKGSYSESNSENAKTFSFANKEVKDLINKKDNSNLIESNIFKYITKYAVETGSSHPRLKLSQWQQVVDNILFESERVGLIAKEYFSKVLEQHFNTNYNNGNCDYNILHFISGRNIQNRVYEVEDELDKIPAP